MKKVIYTLMAAMISLSACKKQQTIAPVSPFASEKMTDADFKDGKAIVISGQKKQTDDGLVLEYDLVIKEVSDNKYKAAIRINDITLNGKKPKGYKEPTYKSIVLGLNTSKEDKAVPLDVLLESPDVSSAKNDQIITFPAFEYKGELAYEVVNTSLTIGIDNPIFQPGTGGQDNVLSLFGMTIVVPNSSVSISGGNFEIKDNSTISMGGGNTTINFGIVNKDKATALTDREEYFVLPSGHTVMQSPEVSKVKIADDGGYVTVVVTGDPAKAVEGVYFKPAPISTNNPKDPKETIQLPTMDFVLTHYNQKNGVQRFKSTKTYKDLYKDATFGISSLSISIRSKS